MPLTLPTCTLAQCQQAEGIAQLTKMDGTTHANHYLTTTDTQGMLRNPPNPTTKAQTSMQEPHQFVFFCRACTLPYCMTAVTAAVPWLQCTACALLLQRVGDLESALVLSCTNLQVQLGPSGSSGTSNQAAMPLDTERRG